MRVGWIAVAISLSAQLGCVSEGEIERRQYLALSPDSKDLFDKYRQFMTDHQQEEFLKAPSDGDRQTQLRDLHIDERIAQYPAFVQKAIWSRTPVVGMDKTALFLTLGKPTSVDRGDYDPDMHILPTEHWSYRRGEMVNQSYEITIVNDAVTEVKTPDIK